MAIYTISATVIGEARLEPANGDMVEIIEVTGDVLKDGVPIGAIGLRVIPSVSNQEIRLAILDQVRDIVEQDLIGIAEDELAVRASAIQGALDSFEKVI